MVHYSPAIVEEHKILGGLIDPERVACRGGHVLHELPRLGDLASLLGNKLARLLSLPEETIEGVELIGVEMRTVWL